MKELKAKAISKKGIFGENGVITKNDIYLLSLPAR
jgi:hypothetical protein